MSDYIQIFIYILFFVHLIAFSFPCSYSLLHTLLQHTVKAMVCATLYKCFFGLYMQQEIQDTLQYILVHYINFLMPIVSKPVFETLVCDFTYCN